MVIQGYGKYPCLSGNIATDHEYDTEFAYRMRKAQAGGGDEAAATKGNGHAEESIQRARTHGGGSFQYACTQILEGDLKRLCKERQ